MSSIISQDSVLQSSPRRVIHRIEDIGRNHDKFRQNKRYSLMNDFSNQLDSHRSNSIGRFADVGVSILKNSARRNSQEIVGNDYTEQN